MDKVWRRRPACGFWWRPAARSGRITGRDARLTRRRGRLRYFFNGPELRGAGQNSSSDADHNLLPLLLRHEGGEGWGEEVVPMSFPLSPFVPHGERGLARRDESSRLDIFAPKHK